MTRIKDNINTQPQRMKGQRDASWALSLLVTISCLASLTTNLPTTEAFHSNKPTIKAGNRVRRNLPELYNHKDLDSNRDEISSGIPHNQHQWLGNLLAATTLLFPIVANAAAADLDLVSPGTTIIETKPKDASKLLQTTETTASKLLDTAVWNSQNRKALVESTQRIQSAIATELSSVEAWRQVIAILKDYGVDLQRETSVVVRPPANVRRALGDATNKKRVTLLVNGEILQIEAHYQTGTNTKEDLQEGKAVQPDDEWVLTIKGYKGFDPDAIILPEKVNPLFSYERKRPVWFQTWDRYWHDPLDQQNPFSKITKTHGDAIVVGGTTAIALSYATSYAYYLDQIEQEEAAAAKKKELAASKKKAAAAKKKLAEETTKETPKKKGFFGGGGDKKKKKKEKPSPKKKVDKPKPAPKKKIDKPKPAPKKEVEKPKAVEKPPKQETTAKEEKKAEEKPEEPAAVEAKKETAEKKEPTTTEATVAVAVDETPKAKDVPKKEAPKKKKVPKTKEPPKPAAIEDTSTKEESKPDNDDEDDDPVKVVIDFDKDGKVVITTVDAAPKRESPIALAQSLLFPWLGFFVSSRLDRDDRRSPIRFVQSLLFPWAGVLFRREQSTTSAGASEDENEKKDKKK